jgi:stearoyl-CoA desaturase (delta-9 desaturase)
MKSKFFPHSAGLFVIAYHLALVVLLPLYLWNYTPSFSLLLTAFILYFFTGLSITVGYHRLWSHSAFKVNKVLEFVILFFGSLSLQGSAIRWAFNHRKHHAFVDTDKDPYNIKRGFWYAHLFWLFEKPSEIDAKIVSDLTRNPLLANQEKYSKYHLLGSNIVLFVILSFCFSDSFGVLVFPILLRIFFLHHCTWFINSLAHTWGSQSFSKEQTAVDNFIISLLTFGEGYHNYHHTFANDYRNGIRWFHFDPSKWIIWLFGKLGWASQLRKIQDSRIQTKILNKTKEAFLTRLKRNQSERYVALEKKVNLLVERISKGINEIQALIDKERTLQKEKYKNTDLLQTVREEIQLMKKNLKFDWSLWKRLIKNERFDEAELY